MRRIALVVAALVTVFWLVNGRQAAAEIRKNTKATNRKHSVERAVGQKPGQVSVPKTPKIKRQKGAQR